MHSFAPGYLIHVCICIISFLVQKSSNELIDLEVNVASFSDNENSIVSSKGMYKL